MREHDVHTVADDRAFILRIWRGARPAAGWHASLQDIRSGRRVGFSSLHALIRHITSLMSNEAASPAPREQPIEADQLHT